MGTKIGARVSEAMIQRLRDMGMGSAFPSRIHIKDEEIRRGVATIKYLLSGHYLPSDGHLEDIVRTILQENRAYSRDEVKDPYQYETEAGSTSGV
jgi:hypothetical protein